MSIRLGMLATSLLFMLFFGGCASIVNGQNQSISVVSKNRSDDLSGAKCSLVNDKGTWYATTPGSVTVRRSYNNLTVSCTAEGVDPGVAMVKSSTKPMAFGNIIFGGIIGAGVDISTGAAYDYPDVVTVQMGKVIGIGTPDATLPSKATADPASSMTRTEPTVPAVPTVPAAPAAAPPLHTTNGAIATGQDAYTVQHLAQDQACRASASPVLTAKGPGFESYVVNCNSGDSLMFRCEFGNCRILK